MRSTASSVRKLSAARSPCHWKLASKTQVQSLPTKKHRKPVGRLGNGSPFFFYDDTSTTLSAAYLSQPTIIRCTLHSRFPFSLLPRPYTHSIPPADSAGHIDRTHLHHSANKASCGRSIFAIPY